jgi:hypothetical protein
MNSERKLFLNLTLFNRVNEFDVILNSHAKPPLTTHFHVDINYHVNPAGSATSFSTQNEPHHFNWRDSSMSRVIFISVTYFGSKSVKSIFLSFNIFL